MVDWLLVAASYIWLIIALFFWLRSPSEIKSHLRLTLLVAILLATYMTLRAVFIEPDGSMPEIIKGMGIFVFFTHTASLFHAVFIYSRALFFFRNAANTDYLTGLLNRRGFEHSCREGHSTELGPRYVVVMIDLLNFKSINDTKGHVFGDKTLRLLARTMIETMRERDILSRYGGDEFLLVLRDTGKEGAEQVVNRFKERLQRRHSLVVNCGIAAFPEDSLELEQLIRIADERMYYDKMQSRVL